MAFGSPRRIHRANAQTWTVQTRDAAKLARSAARAGRCRDALHYFGLAAYKAGRAVQERGHAGGPRRAKIQGGSNMGKIVLGLQRSVFRACRIG